MSSGHICVFFVAAVAASPAAWKPAYTQTSAPGPWGIEPFRTGYAAVSRSEDHRAALLIFCALHGARSIVYAFDGRGLRSKDIPISQVTVQATPMIDLMGVLVPSRSATFDNDGYVIRMQIRLPADFDPVHASRRTIESGPGAAKENRWSVFINEAGLDDSVRLAFKNCI